MTPEGGGDPRARRGGLGVLWRDHRCGSAIPFDSHRRGLFTPSARRWVGMLWTLTFNESGFLLGELAEERSELVAHPAEFGQPLFF
jgi:hypothetical protein